MLIEDEEDDEVEFQIINIRMSIPRMPRDVGRKTTVKSKNKIGNLWTT